MTKRSRLSRLIDSALGRNNAPCDSLEIRKRLHKFASAATQGAWEFYGHQREYQIRAVGPRTVVCGGDLDVRDEHGIRRHSDAQFIAAANPETILALLSEMRELEKEIEHWKANHCECVRRKRVSNEHARGK